MTLQEKLDALRAAGLHIGQSNPREAYERGWVSWGAFAPGYSEWYDDDARPVVMVEGARDDNHDASTVDRSNYRSLQRDFPNVFVRVSYSDTDALCAFVHSMTDVHVNLIIGLVVDYHVYDESDVSELESEEIADAWSQYLRSDMELSDEWEQVADLFDDAEFRRQFESECWSAQYYPEHDGRDIRWDMDYVRELAERALTSLVHESYGLDLRSDPVLPLAV